MDTNKPQLLNAVLGLYNKSGGKLAGLVIEAKTLPLTVTFSGTVPAVSLTFSALGISAAVVPPDSIIAGDK